MKSAVLVSLIFVFGVFQLSSALAATPAPVECYKLAMSDPAVFVNEKGCDTLTAGGTAESTVLKLCAGATLPEAPVTCYKSAMSDPSVFASGKARDKSIAAQGEGGNFCDALNASAEAVQLCAAAAN